MECPHCNSEIEGNTSLCPVCRGKLNVQRIVLTDVKNVAKEVKKDDDYEVFDENEVFVEIKEKNDVIFIIMIILSVVSILAIAVFLFIYLFNSHDSKIDPVTTTSSTVPKMSGNEGVIRTRYSPGVMGEKMLATFYDKENNKKTTVDLLVHRALNQAEINELISTNEIEYEYNEGSSWYGFIYTVFFNDLDYLAGDIDPIIDTAAYDELGNDFYLIPGDKYVKFFSKSFYSGKKIHNGERATIKVLFYVPDIDLSLCFGDRTKTLACIKK